MVINRSGSNVAAYDRSTDTRGSGDGHLGPLVFYKVITLSAPLGQGETVSTHRPCLTQACLVIDNFDHFKVSQGELSERLETAEGKLHRVSAGQHFGPEQGAFCTRTICGGRMIAAVAERTAAGGDVPSPLPVWRRCSSRCGFAGLDVC